MTTKDDEHSYERFIFSRADKKIRNFLLALSLLTTGVITTSQALSFLYPTYFLVSWSSIAFGAIITFMLIAFTCVFVVQRTTVLMLESLEQITEAKDHERT